MNCEICKCELTESSARYEMNIAHCKNCFGSAQAKEYILSKTALSKSASEANLPITADDEYSPLSLLLFLLSAIALLGGIFICAVMWPDATEHELKILTYTPSITWLITGVVQFSLYAALGQGLHYLKLISKSSKHTPPNN